MKRFTAAEATGDLVAAKLALASEGKTRRRDQAETAISKKGTEFGTGVLRDFEPGGPAGQITGTAQRRAATSWRRRPACRFFQAPRQR